MTAEERVEEDVNEGEEVPVAVAVVVPVPVPVPVPEELESAATEEPKEDPTCVIIVDTIVEPDVLVEDTEVNAKRGFTPEEPEPYGPDESLTEPGKEDEEECGFCLFMKAGPCGKRFAAWEACVDDAETAGVNIVEKCAPKTHFLKECMEAHPEHYGPVLQAEKAIDQQATMEAKTGNEENNSGSLESIPA